MDKWPEQFTIDQASKFLQRDLPALRLLIADFAEEITTLKEQIVHLEATKASKRGPKPSGAKTLVEDDDGR